ncbi:MAG: hypothetical protein ACLSWS_11060 [Faecalispora jeddahensis]
MNLLMKGAALAPPFSCTTKYSSDVYSPRPPDIRVRLLPTKPPVHFTTEQPGRDSTALFQLVEKAALFRQAAYEQGLRPRSPRTARGYFK